MKIRNRISDISTLQVNILQDYFRMTVAVNFVNDEWKLLFLEKVIEGEKSKYRTSYMGAWEKIQNGGIENYSIDDMDTTIIDAILKGSPENPFYVCRIGSAYDHIHKINSNRNTIAHLTGNESETKILLLSNDSLDNLSKLIAEVANAEKCTVPNESRDLYARKYRAEIKELNLNIEKDYEESIEMKLIEQSIKDNISLIKNSKNPEDKFVNITGQYMNTLNKRGHLDLDLLYRFMITAADEGILWAYSWAGDCYFYGDIRDKNYVKAAEYYKKGFDNITPEKKLKLASIYLNNLSGSYHTKEEAMSIIKSCERPQYEIVTYTSKDGYEFYTQKRKVNEDRPYKEGINPKIEPHFGSIGKTRKR